MATPDSTHLEEICPLCDWPARYTSADHGNAKDVRCERCTVFRITSRAERALVVEYNLLRELLAPMAARAPDGQALLIDMRPAGNEGHPVNARYVQVSQLTR